VLRKLVHRLQELPRDQPIVACGGQLESAVRFTKDSYHRLKSALTEVRDAASVLQQAAAWDDFEAVAAALESGTVAAESTSQEICRVYDRVISTAPPILLQGACYRGRGVSRT
jgi:hypothetical protein